MNLLVGYVLVHLYASVAAASYYGPNAGGEYGSANIARSIAFNPGISRLLISDTGRTYCCDFGIVRQSIISIDDPVVTNSNVELRANAYLSPALCASFEKRRGYICPRCLISAENLIAMRSCSIGFTLRRPLRRLSVINNANIIGEEYLCKVSERSIILACSGKTYYIVFLPVMRQKTTLRGISHILLQELATNRKVRDVNNNFILTGNIFPLISMRTSLTFAQAEMNRIGLKLKDLSNTRLTQFFDLETRRNPPRHAPSQRLALSNTAYNSRNIPSSPLPLSAGSLSSPQAKGHNHKGAKPTATPDTFTVSPNTSSPSSGGTYSGTSSGTVTTSSSDEEEKNDFEVTHRDPSDETEGNGFANPSKKVIWVLFLRRWVYRLYLPLFFIT